MKKFIISGGKLLINVAVILEILIALGISIGTGFGIGESTYNGFLGFAGGCFAFLILLIMVIFGNFLFYQFISIVDSFESIAKDLHILVNGKGQSVEIIENKNVYNTTAQTRCPQCGATYSDGDQFCGECGKKLN